VVGTSSGQAVMQLNVQYGIDVEDLRDTPSRPYFDLYVDETYSHFRNKSHINVTACAKWLALDESPHSATAVLEIDMPSGYNIIISDADQVIKKSEFNFLRDVVVTKDKVIWVIDKVIRILLNKLKV
jgi:CD109 antigen